MISLLNSSELLLLICAAKDINVEDMKRHTHLSGWTPQAKEIKWFWALVLNLKEIDRKKLLQFITGSSSLPSDGFSALKPKLTVTRSYTAKDGYPSSHTCFNQLLIPNYSSYASLESKFLIAINEGTPEFSDLS